MQKLDLRASSMFVMNRCENLHGKADAMARYLMMIAWAVIALTIRAEEAPRPVPVANEKPVVLSPVVTLLEQFDVEPNDPRGVTLLWITRVTKGSTAEKIGLRTGMRVIAINGIKPIGQSLDYLRRQVAANYRADLTITVKPFLGKPRDFMFPPPAADRRSAK